MASTERRLLLLRMRMRSISVLQPCRSRIDYIFGNLSDKQRQSIVNAIIGATLSMAQGARLQSSALLLSLLTYCATVYYTICGFKKDPFCFWT
jgi:hypothetical protein